MSWKDLNHPQAGGAEVVTVNLLKRLASDGHEVVLLTSRYPKSSEKDHLNGYQVIRNGGRYGVYFKSYQYYKKYLQGWADLVIDECNTLPFMTKFYVKEPTLMVFYMLCREIWFYQLPKYIGWIGYILEPVYLRMLSSQKVLTISESSRQDLIKHGFEKDNIEIISVGIGITPVQNYRNITKYDKPTLLSLGSVRPMKQTLDQVKAFEIAKQSFPDLRLMIAGDYSGTYGESVQQYVSNSEFSNDISMLGRISEEQKIELTQKSHISLVTSVKEGWGLIVTEANSQGTPSVVYDVDGLRDSVKHGVTGLVTKTTPAALAESTIVLLNNHELYDKIREAAHAWSKQITFEQSYEDFKKGAHIE